MAEEGGGGGISIEEQIAEAAIKADLEHRGFKDSGGGSFYKQQFGSSKNGVHPQYTYHLTKDSLRIEKTPNVDNEDLTAEAAGLLSRLQSEVFNYWPGAIDELFRKWQEATLPSWGGLAMDASWAKGGADEIRPGTTVKDNGADLQVGNGRLGADLESLKMRCGQLSGAYAKAFTHKYAIPLPGVLQGQFALASVLAIALETEKEIWLRTSRDLSTLKSHALTAMRASGPKSGGDGGELKVVVTVFAALAGAVAVFATAGSALAIAGGLAAAGGGAWSNLIKDPPQKTEETPPLGAGKPHDVLKNIEQALNKVNEGIKSQEEFLRQILNGAEVAATDKKYKGMFDLDRVAVEGQVLAPQQDLIVDPTSIAGITAQWIPCIVGDLRRAQSRLGADTSRSWERPDGLGVGHSGAHPEFKKLQDTVFELLRNTADELDEAGGLLLAAARGIGEADDAEQAKYAAIAKRVNDDNINTPGQ